MRIDEIYLSIQGEGPNVGMPTVFIRFGGCNLRCEGWPCDTPHAVLIENRNAWQERTPAEVFAEVCKIIDEYPGVNICLTGGEPFLQKHDELSELVDYLDEHLSVNTIECFSNGTILYPEWAYDVINFVMDWKLPGSGEDSSNINRIKNVARFTSRDVVKFTITGVVDYAAAVAIWRDIIKDQVPCMVYLGAVWDRISYEKVAQLMLQHTLPWTFNMQIHNHIWDRSKRGI